MTTAARRRRSVEYLKLTPQRQVFIDAMLLSPKPAQAALSADYSTPNEGARLLTNAVIRDALQAERDIAQQDSGITLDSVLVRLNDEGNDADSSRDRIRALELVGKLLGGFVKRIELGGTIAHVHVLAGISDEDLTDLVAELRARRNAPALVDGTATVVDGPRDGDGGEE